MKRRHTFQARSTLAGYPPSRRIRLTLTISLLLVGTAALALLAVNLLGSPSERPFPNLPSAAGMAGTTEQDGRLAEGEVTVFDETHPAISNLNPALLHALQTAANEAAAEDIVFYVNGGWRSAQLQEEMLDDAVDEYGSREEALRWVATPERSAHVSGDAVDIGFFDASYWLRLNGDRYGICQVYENEPWHFEMRRDAQEDGCPDSYADPTEDPRMHEH